jgi:hypothetical protein
VECCDGKDNDGDGKIDEGTGKICDLGMCIKDPYKPCP